MSEVEGVYVALCERGMGSSGRQALEAWNRRVARSACESTTSAGDLGVVAHSRTSAKNKKGNGVPQIPASPRGLQVATLSKSSAGDLGDVTQSSTSAGDLGDVTQSSTSAGDLGDVTQSSTSAGDLGDVTQSSTSAGDLGDVTQSSNFQAGTWGMYTKFQLREGTCGDLPKFNFSGGEVGWMLQNNRFQRSAGDLGAVTQSTTSAADLGAVTQSTSPPIGDAVMTPSLGLRRSPLWWEVAEGQQLLHHLASRISNSDTADQLCASQAARILTRTTADSTGGNPSFTRGILNRLKSPVLPVRIFPNRSLVDSPFFCLEFIESLANCLADHVPHGVTSVAVITGGTGNYFGVYGSAALKMNCFEAVTPGVPCVDSILSVGMK
eukprot:gene22609-29750_t